MPKTFVGGPLFFGNVLASKDFWITSYHHFVEIFGLTSPKITVSEHVCVSELFWFQKFLANRGITGLSIVFVSQRRKICGEPSNDSKKLGRAKILCIIGEFHVFLLQTSSLTVPNTSVEEGFCLSKVC